jgi:hypothetical protein
MPWKYFRIMAIVKGILNQYFITGQFVKSVQMKDFKIKSYIKCIPEKYLMIMTASTGIPLKLATVVENKNQSTILPLLPG